MKQSRINPIGKKGRRIKAEMDALRPELLKRARGCCEHCGIHLNAFVWIPDRHVLEMHHLDHNRNNTTPENCRMLAPYCHDVHGHGKGGTQKPKDWEGWDYGK